MFAQVDMRRGVDITVSMTDACLSGFAVGEAVWSKEDVLGVAEHDDRWRFREMTPSDPTFREKALSEHEEQMYAYVHGDVFLDPNTVC